VVVVVVVLVVVVVMAVVVMVVVVVMAVVVMVVVVVMMVVVVAMEVAAWQALVVEPGPAVLLLLAGPCHCCWQSPTQALQAVLQLSLALLNHCLQQSIRAAKVPTPASLGSLLCPPRSPTAAVIESGLLASNSGSCDGAAGAGCGC
jgi:hypothetical protein